jgi:transcriptional regulator with XRE-family HTH domain
MAPLDTGYVMNLRLVDPLGERIGPSPADFDKIGAYLRAVREHRGFSLSDLSDITRISKAYLQGIEDGNISALPSRPFAIGYVRSYAQALGIDGDAAAARFKSETPDFTEPLRNPIGVKHEKKHRNPLIFAVIGLIVSGVVLWNVAQRSLTGSDPASVPSAGFANGPAAEPVAPHGPITLGAATPPPADQTMPVAYVTPGMDMAGSKNGEQTKVVKDPAVAAPAGSSGYLASTVFTPKGAIYGAPANIPGVILQAKKAASLVVRGAGGAVYFARQLAPGEAYRAPLGAGLTADVADPAAFDLYVDGQTRGSAPSGQTPIDKLVHAAA